jgi:hypothetical protein
MRISWVLVVLVLCACSKKAEQTPPAGGSAGSAAPAAAPTAPPTTATTATTGCAMLTKDEAARLLGGEVEDCIESDEEGLGCLYNAKVGNDAVALIVYSGDGNAKFEMLKKTEDEPVDVPGIGDHAYRTKSGTMLGFVAHGRCALLTFNIMASTAKQPPEVGIEVAKAIASRL